MKKPFRLLLLTGLLMFSLQVLGQSEQIPFTPSSPDTNLMTDQGGIKVSYLKGTLNTMPSVYFIFKNNSGKTVDLMWMLKNKSGEVVFTSQPLHLEAGHTIDLNHSDNNMVSATGLTNFLYFIKDGINITDLKMSINL